MTKYTSNNTKMTASSMCATSMYGDVMHWQHVWNIFLKNARAEAFELELAIHV